MLNISDSRIHLVLLLLLFVLLMLAWYPLFAHNRRKLLASKAQIDLSLSAYSKIAGCFSSCCLIKGKVLLIKRPHQGHGTFDYAYF